MKACSHCESRAISRGYCAKHYQRWKKHGDALAGKSQAPAGSGWVSVAGYPMRHRNGKCVPEHVLIAEAALGKPLPPGSVVHHMDENPGNNAPGNLVICPSQAYHMLIHKRARALAACGNANWLKCVHCQRFDDPDSMYQSPSGAQVFHRACHAAYVRSRGAIKEGRHEQALAA